MMRLSVAAASSFFGEAQYYQPDKKEGGKLSARFEAQLRPSLGESLLHSYAGLTPTELMERAIDDALAYDPLQTLELAVHLRQEAHIRVTPQVIMVRAANAEFVRAAA